ncbi:MAG: Rpn family recombination-promoting nuclease/putative transposase [Bacteroidota bacterium]
MLEHKSYVPPYPPLQLLGYQIQVWKHYIANEEKPITVLPILFYHGKEPWDNRPWKDFLEGMSPEFEKYTPAWEYILIDLSEMSDDEIWSFRVVFLVTGLLLLKHRYDRQFLLNHLEQLAKFVGQSGNKNDRVIFIRYVFAISLLSKKEVGERIFKSSRIMKTASAMEEWKEDVWLEAKQEGKQEGRQEGIAIGDYLRSMKVVQGLLLKFPGITNEDIAIIGGLEVAVVQKIRRELESKNDEKRQSSN